MKTKFCLFVLILMFLALISCANNRSIEDDTGESDSTSSIDTEQPEYSNPEMDKFVSDFIGKWKSGEISSLYSHLSPEYADYINKEEFKAQFDYYSEFGGGIVKESSRKAADEGAVITYSINLEFKYIDASFTLSIGNSADNTIIAYGIDFKFRQAPVDIDRGNGIYERLFLFETNGHFLNASYVYLKDKPASPTALIVPEYGYTDVNYTYGATKAYYDLANSLALNGIASFRMEKSSFRYSYNYLSEYTIEEEYFIDYRNAIDYLKKQSPTSGLYLIGHSFGSNIAAKLASEDNAVKKIVCLNGTVRSMAESAKELYIYLDPGRKEQYREEYDKIIACTQKNAKGEVYLALSDYYWASVNLLDTESDLSNANIPVLAINSTYDIQHVASDIEAWKSAASKNKNIKTIVHDRMSYVLYEIDITDIFTISRIHVLPDYLIEEITNFILD